MSAVNPSSRGSRVRMIFPFAGFFETSSVSNEMTSSRISAFVDANSTSNIPSITEGLESCFPTR